MTATEPRTETPAAARIRDLLADCGIEATPAELESMVRELVRLAPDDPASVRRLQAVCIALSKVEEATELAGRLAKLSETQVERSDWAARQARLYAERLNRPQEAAGLFLQLLSENVATGVVLGGLERLATTGVRTGEIAEALGLSVGSVGTTLARARRRTAARPWFMVMVITDSTSSGVETATWTVPGGTPSCSSGPATPVMPRP